MRFHHSTRRGRTKYSQPQHTNSHSKRLNHFSSKWTQLGYCRETNIHFNRRLPVHFCDIQPAEQSDRLSDGQLMERLCLEDQSNADDTNNQPANQPTNSDAHREKQGAQADTPTGQRHEARQRVNLSENLEFSIDMDSVRQKLVAQVDKHPFWSNKAARRMELRGVERRLIYIYELVSFCERRDLEWRYEPYRGGLVPGTPSQRPALVGLTAPESIELATSSLATPNRSLRASSPLTSTADSAAWRSHSPDPPPKAPERPLFAARAGARHLSGQSSHPATPSRQISSSCSLDERRMPSAELVWSIKTPDSGAQAGVQNRAAPFIGQMHSCEMPGSFFVKRCHGCQGRGRLKCSSCFGVGYEVCISCSGKGSSRTTGLGGGQLAGRPSSEYRAYKRGGGLGAGDERDNDCFAGGGISGGAAASGSGRYGEPGGICSSAGSSAGILGSGAGWATETCHFCHGAGQKRCWVCAGKSYNHCQGCLGHGQLRCFLQLNISMANHRDESILNNTDSIIPKDRLRLASGQLLADETKRRLQPLSPSQMIGSHELLARDSQQIQTASRRLLDRHHEKYRTERLMCQKHKVTQIECHKVEYEWKQRRGHFVIYGDERKVYIAKYPFKSICSIT